MCSRVYVSVRCGAALRACVLHAIGVRLLLNGKGMKSACSLRSLLTPFPNRSEHALSPTVSSDFPGVAREGPEATPLTSIASTF